MVPLPGIAGCSGQADARPRASGLADARDATLDSAGIYPGLEINPLVSRSLRGAFVSFCDPAKRRLQAVNVLASDIDVDHRTPVLCMKPDSGG
jgi:hypothetical protein